MSKIKKYLVFAYPKWNKNTKIPCKSRMLLTNRKYSGWSCICLKPNQRNVPSHPRGSFRKNIWIIKQSSKQQLPDEEYKLSSCEFRTVSGRATFKFFFSPFSYKIRRGEKSNQIELISTKICFYEWFNMAKNTHTKAHLQQEKKCLAYIKFASIIK